MKTRPASSIHAVARLLLVLVLAGAWGAQPVWGQQTAPSRYQLDIVGPPGSELFGDYVTALPNGNIVVTDRYYDAGTVLDVGAVYLYDGGTGALISMLTGSTAFDQVGRHGVTVLANGNFVVSIHTGIMALRVSGGSHVGQRHHWGHGHGVGGQQPGGQYGGRPDWRGVCDGLIGVGQRQLCGAQRVLEQRHSRVRRGGHLGERHHRYHRYRVGGQQPGGQYRDDRVGGRWAAALTNGNYVLTADMWDNGAIVDVGAATWADGTSGITGTISAANSLVGSRADDRVGGWGATALSNGHYVVSSPSWDNGALVKPGRPPGGTAPPGSPAPYRRPTAWWAVPLTTR